MKRILTLLLYICLCSACSSESELSREQFADPDRSSYPETWFHFIGTNVSLEGITADLEAIAQAGISGVQFFHGDKESTKWPGTEGGITPLSAEWDVAVKHIAQECDRLGLLFSIQNCPGWAMAGGPWIKPENAMRTLIKSRTDVIGKEIDAFLPQPQPSTEPWRDYREIAVLAFPTPEGDTGSPLKVKNIKGPKGYPWEEVFSDRKGYIENLPMSDMPYVITMDFVEPSTLRTIALPGIHPTCYDTCYDPEIYVKAYVFTADGKEHKIADLAYPAANWQDDDPFTIACPEVEDAVSFRFEFLSPRKNVDIEHISLYSAARKNSWESEAGLTLRAFERSADDVMQSREAYVSKDAVIDITGYMTADGHLKWTAPDEKAWTILRIGHINEGKKNKPAPPEGTGWECDKLSTEGAEAHFPGYVGRLLDGALQGGLLDGILLDSWECSTQMWTKEMEKEFVQHCGYALREWLPALFGYVMEDPQTTSRFLLDWRGTLSNLYTERFFRRIAELGHENGLRVVYETAGGDVLPSDIMEYFKYADIPMCEFWHPFNTSSHGTLNFKPIKPTASAARMYGKSRVAAESYTSYDLSWNETLEMFKEYADYHFVEGVTHNVFHTYTHNPQTDYLKPGTSFGTKIGSPFLRGQTWWPYMRDFTTYLSRCTYMLEHGRPVSAVLWYLGDEISHKPDQECYFPEGYKYDYCNPDVLLKRLSVKDGKIMTPEGISYEMLWIPENKRMLPETIARIHELILDGAKVAAMPPQSIATLIGGEENVRRYDEEVESLWGNVQYGELVKIGKGCLLCDTDIDKAVKAFGIKPDMLGDVRWIHRQDEGMDWYFVTPMKASTFSGTVEFASAGAVELWNPLTGMTESIEAEFKDGRTSVNLDLARAGSCFIVINRTKKHVNPEITKKVKIRTAIDNIWKMTFPEGWGAPGTIETAELKPWCELPVSDEAKAFSGKVTYTTSFMHESSDAGKSVMLDLGKVADIAEVRVNGETVDTLWCQPYITEIGKYLKDGENCLEVDVTSTWYNRLVYDASQKTDARKTWVIAGPDKESSLKPYGLLGPVVMTSHSN